MLETFCEYTQERWHKEPKDSALKRIAKIISWNLWQMDGIKGIIPHKGIAKEPAEENEQYQLTLFEIMGVAESEPKSNEILQETIDCKIYDWREDKSVIYKSMKEG